jgi:hypothetical protein
LLFVRFDDDLLLIVFFPISGEQEKILPYKKEEADPSLRQRQRFGSYP